MTPVAQALKGIYRSRAAAAAQSLMAGCQAPHPPAHRAAA